MLPYTSSFILAGELTATAAAQRLSADSKPCLEVLIQNDPANTVGVYIGNALEQVIHLLPGAGIAIEASNVNNFFVRAASGTARVAWLART